MFNTKTDAEMTPAEIAARNAERKALRDQIARDQATNAKRDAKALRAERAWLKRNGKI